MHELPIFLTDYYMAIQELQDTNFSAGDFIPPFGDNENDKLPACPPQSETSAIQRTIAALVAIPTSTSKSNFQKI